MALPTVFNTRTVYDDFINLTGAPVLGSVKFSAHITRWTVLDGPSIVPVDISVPITQTTMVFTNSDGSTETLTTGRFTVDLPLSVDSDLVQNDSYTVTVSLVDGSGATRVQAPYEIVLTAGSPVRLRNMAPAGPVSTTVAYLTDGAASATYETKAHAASSYMAVVTHGSNASTARPAGAPAVFWIGSVSPTNATTFDFWYDTTT